MTIDDTLIRAGKTLEQQPVAVPDPNRLVARSRRRRVLAAGVGFVVIALGAAGALRWQTSPADVIELAAGRMGNVSSYRVTALTEGREEGDDTWRRFSTMEVAVDVERRLSHSTMSSPYGEAIEGRNVDGVVYQTVPRRLREPMGIDTKWVAAPNEGNELWPTGLSLERVVAEFREPALVADIEKVGDESIRGFPATRYRISLTPDEMERLEARNREVFEAAGGPEVTTTPHSATIDVWVDRDGFVRRTVRVSARTVAVAGQDDNPALTYTRSVTDIDVNVEVGPVTPPRENEVTRFDDAEEYLDRWAEANSQLWREAQD